MLQFASLLFEILNLYLVRFQQLTLRFFGLLNRYVFPSEDLLFGLLYQCIKVLLISLVGEAGVVLTTIAPAPATCAVSRFVPINLTISADAVSSGRFCVSEELRRICRIPSISRPVIDPVVQGI